MDIEELRDSHVALLEYVVFYFCTFMKLNRVRLRNAFFFYPKIGGYLSLTPGQVTKPSEKNTHSAEEFATNAPPICGELLGALTEKTKYCD